ncbi:glycosyltransferase family 4 protein [Polymorphobacter fuscus]|uniref:Glycosyltransferase n=1 Tax=Sandarakinorhabdus fusca TaxID=1439888 RepID=A0A7C9GPJ0_9SPHN|nr:glycosyltransferase family 1 protein [Polymorphobacter fuscus]KAB7648208.1 glycosyltransferase family 1 protein [Polymorphobacter fuscus]MQT15711.1 glycosyltransferase [Polymorphobacter fuscus]NJC08018.1 glycosyltransferase involved in cell wall biosynthesis [Polymorphobacter fuscus]
MRIAVVSDAWTPQVNGVVRTLTTVIALARGRGHRVLTVTPDRFHSMPMPNYPEIRLALTTQRAIGTMIGDFAPDAIHIATEGPLGWLARRWCVARGIAFTTSFHTRFPDYIAARTGLSPALLWRPLVRFHRPAQHILVATPRLAGELADKGLHQTLPWTRGVDAALFHPDREAHPALADLPRPIALHVGRVAVEKNVEAFLAAEWHGSKVVVGDGPALDALQARFPQAHFLGSLHGEALASTYVGADIVVFPSRTDTFGLVIIEALACGTPVAGYPVPGPLDILGGDGCGTEGPAARIGGVDADLATAMRAALTADRADCARYGGRFSWDRSCDQFLSALAPVDQGAVGQAA